MRPPLPFSCSAAQAPRTLSLRTFFRQPPPTRKRCRHWLVVPQLSPQEHYAYSSFKALAYQFRPIQSRVGNHKPPSTLLPPRRVPIPIQIPSQRRQSPWLPNDNPSSVGEPGFARRYASSSSSSPQPPPSRRRRRRSPYAVLGLRTGSSAKTHTTPISQDDIKAAFRKLAKIYHPDLNPHNRPREDCEVLMSELLEAYERLMKDDPDEDDFLEHVKVGASNKVALACELYSVDELLMDRFHEVHALTIEYTDTLQLEEDDANHNHNCDDDELAHQDSVRAVGSADRPCRLPSAAAQSVSIPFPAHPGDSVLDLKERLESEFSGAWGLEESIGWELVAVRRPARTDTDHQKENENQKEEDPSTVAANNVVLSYHLFLEDYEIQHGDTIYAVVRTND